MGNNKTLATAIAFALATPTLSHSVYAADESASGLAEIIVTAQRRSENLQSVPISIQAITGEAIAQMNVATFDDYVKFLPNVTTASFGPGQGEIYMRGLSLGTQGPQGNGVLGNFPNVAVYVDEQSSMLPSHNLDVYAVDLERIEVLEGPQGTLFGGGAQAGVVRYITQKPKLNVTEGAFNASYGATAHGDPNTAVDGMLNLPLIADRLAVRAVLYNDARGGYINNVPSTFTRSNSDVGISYAGGSVPANSPVINNYSLVRNAINPVTYQGARLQALWKVNDDWDVLLSQSYQNTDAQGVFYQMPTGSDGQKLPDLSVTLFNPSDAKDKFSDTSLTVTGKVGDLKLVYAAGYLNRNIEQYQDYTNYSRGYFADYYQCYGGWVTGTPTCYSPSASWSDHEHATHQSHELRLSTPDDRRIRAVGGVFWEDFTVAENTDWMYRTLPACTDANNVGCLSNIAPAPGSTVANPGTRNSNVSYLVDAVRGYQQYAFYLSTDVDIIPKVLTATVGTRYYHFTNTEKGAYGGGFGCFEAGSAPCTAGGASIDAEHLKQSYSGARSRANITWKITPDAMVYYTWSQGYRPGGFNRTSNGPFIADVNGVNQFYTPKGYAPDDLVNNEIGWKTEWFGHRFLFNGAIYREQWNNVQFSVFNPAYTGSQAFVTNGPDYEVKGLELQFIARLTAGLTLQAGASWNSSKQTNAPVLIANNPDSSNFGKPVYEVVNGASTPIPNIYGVAGSPLAMSPPFQGNIHLRYEWQVGDYGAFAQAGAVTTGHSYNVVGSAPSIAPSVYPTQSFDQPGYTTYDASFGVSRDAWTAQVYAQNLTDTRGKVFLSDSQALQTQTVTRPRVIGVKFGYKFGGR
jgi:outer membrane receptor protein involved in Fe transport